MKKVVKTEVFGYPKIGVNRELKKAFGQGKYAEIIFF
jgi:hypothetical protein